MESKRKGPIAEVHEKAPKRKIVSAWEIGTGTMRAPKDNEIVFEGVMVRFETPGGKFTFAVGQDGASRFVLSFVNACEVMWPDFVARLGMSNGQVMQ